MTSESELKFEIGHVLLIDIVGYSKLLINEQRERLQELNEIVRQSAQVRAAEKSGMVLRLPTGDGMALVFRDSPETPVRSAMEICEALRSYPELPVRMGIHSGPVSEVSDVNERTNIAGAGINMAQRVMDCGDAGHILLSKRVADDLAQYRHWQPHLLDLGECEVKHGTRLHVFNFYTTEVGNAEVPHKFQLGREKGQSAARSRSPLRSKPLLIALVIIAVIFALAAARFFSQRRAPATLNSVFSALPAASASGIPAKSIAVLPFDNLSRDPDNAYFAEGVQDEILTRLAKVADLKVISRTSTQRFKSVPDNLPQIAKQLGVMHILEGSVQKANDQVRVNVQLINALTDAHLWAETYDRKLTDIFAVETEIATTIAETLQAKLTGSEKTLLAKKPTAHPEAYELYLKGRFFWSKRGAANLRKSIDYFQQAIEKDPNYALAYAGLAQAWNVLPGHNGGAPKDCYPQAETAAKKALSLDGDLADARATLAEVKASYYYDFAGAAAEFERVLQLHPNDATAHHWFANNVLAALGQSERAVAEMKRALALDPLSLIINTNLGYAYHFAGQTDEAIAQLRKTLEIDDGFAWAHRALGEALKLKGQIPEALAEYEKAVALSNEPNSLGALGNLYGIIGREDDATKILEQLKETRQHTYFDAFALALVSLGLGDRDQALNWLEQGFQERSSWLIYIRVEPLLKPLHGDPRFEALAEKIVPAREFAKSATPLK